jgi:hypothetical protein
MPYIMPLHFDVTWWEGDLEETMMTEEIINFMKFVRMRPVMDYPMSNLTNTDAVVQLW